MRQYFEPITKEIYLLWKKSGQNLYNTPRYDRFRRRMTWKKFSKTYDILHELDCDLVQEWKNRCPGKEEACKAFDKTVFDTLGGLQQTKDIVGAKTEGEDEFRWYMRKCNVCGLTQKQKKLKKCGSCKCVFYCSLECQKRDWKDHKKVCKTLTVYRR